MMKVIIHTKEHSNTDGKFKTKRIALTLVAENMWEELALEAISNQSIKVEVENK